jgi:hypothetical protein
MWAGITAAHVIGCSFFDAPINATSDIETFVVWLIPQLEDR